MGQSTILPAGLGPAQFLATHWQKRPLLARQVVGSVLPRISRDELLELACRAGTTSRLVIGGTTAADWSQSQGPFEREKLQALPSTGWTVLVHEVDRRLTAFARLLDRFRFLPNWRIDDVMVSFAVDGGGVGPHIDRYDVFLLQLAGRRRWRIRSEPLAEARLVPGIELPLLESFDHDREWELDAGDMLYLPPRIAHEGVALGECITASIGFRVPDPRELGAGYLRRLAPRVFDELRYADPGAQIPENSGEIVAAARRELRESAMRPFHDEAEFDRWVGCLVTRPARGMPPRAEQPIRSLEQLSARLASGEILVRSAPPHFAWYVDEQQRVQLFVGGESYDLGRKRQSEAELLCGTRTLDGRAVSPWLDDDLLCGVLIDAVLRGFLSLRAVGR